MPATLKALTTAPENEHAALVAASACGNSDIVEYL